MPNEDAYRPVFQELTKETLENVRLAVYATQKIPPEEANLSLEDIIKMGLRQLVPRGLKQNNNFWNFVRKKSRAYIDADGKKTSVIFLCLKAFFF